jgi:hypothetical protein
VLHFGKLSYRVQYWTRGQTKKERKKEEQVGRRRERETEEREKGRKGERCSLFELSVSNKEEKVFIKNYPRMSGSDSLGTTLESGTYDIKLFPLSMLLHNNKLECLSITSF